MAKCAYCGTTVVFGGKQSGDLRFCSAKCQQRGFLVAVARQIPPEVINRLVQQVHHGACPVCKQQNGRVDVHTAHQVWSLIYLTSWSSKPQVSCRRCGLKHQALYTAFTLVAGWWGIPWGFIMTPVQLVRNVKGMLREDGVEPTPELARVLSMNVAAQEIQKNPQLAQR